MIRIIVCILLLFVSGCGVVDDEPATEPPMHDGKADDPTQLPRTLTCRYFPGSSNPLMQQRGREFSEEVVLAPDPERADGGLKGFLQLDSGIYRIMVTARQATTSSRFKFDDVAIVSFRGGVQLTVGKSWGRHYFGSEVDSETIVLMSHHGFPMRNKAHVREAAFEIETHNSDDMGSVIGVECTLQ